MTTIETMDIEWLAANRPRDLHDLLMGTSAYSNTPNDSCANRDEHDPDWTLVIHHLIFAQQFGASARNIEGEWNSVSTLGKTIGQRVCK